MEKMFGRDGARELSSLDGNSLQFVKDYRATDYFESYRSLPLYMDR